MVEFGNADKHGAVVANFGYQGLTVSFGAYHLQPNTVASQSAQRGQVRAAATAAVKLGGFAVIADHAGVLLHRHPRKSWRECGQRGAPWWRHHQRVLIAHRARFGGGKRDGVFDQYERSLDRLPPVSGLSRWLPPVLTRNPHG